MQKARTMIRFTAAITLDAHQGQSQPDAARDIGSTNCCVPVFFGQMPPVLVEAN